MAHGLGTGATWRMLSSKRPPQNVDCQHAPHPSGPRGRHSADGEGCCDILTRLRLDRSSTSKLPSLDCSYIGCLYQSSSIRASCSRCLRSIQPAIEYRGAPDCARVWLSVAPQIAGLVMVRQRHVSRRRTNSAVLKKKTIRRLWTNGKAKRTFGH